MKTNQNKFTVILMIISLITAISLLNCGQQDKSKNKEANTEPSKEEVKIPVVTNDSQTSITPNPVNIENPDKPQPEVKADTIKEIIPAGKTKVPEPVKKLPVEKPVVTDKKTDPDIKVTPPGDKVVIKPEEKPVVKITEPVKPKPDTLPKTTDVIKPVTVDKPQPAQSGWIVPDKYVNMSNPVKADAKSIAAGKALFQVNCESCHGKKGLGNGSKAPDLKKAPGNFTKATFQAQTDGAIFYKITEGKGEMPKAKKDLPNDIDRWNLVNYIRTFAVK